MNALTILFVGLLFGGLYLFGTAVREMVVAVVRPQGGRILKISALSFSVVILLLGALMAGVSLDIATPDSLRGFGHWSLLALLFSASSAFSIKIALAKKPEEVPTEPETGIPPELNAALQPAVSVPSASTVVPATGAPTATAILPARAVPAVSDPMDDWADDTLDSEAATSAPVLIVPNSAAPLVSELVTPVPGTNASSLETAKTNPGVMPDLAEAAERAEAQELADTRARACALVRSVEGPRVKTTARP